MAIEHPNMLVEAEQCSCVNCDFSRVCNLKQWYHMIYCPHMLMSCSRIMKLFKNGYVCIKRGPNENIAFVEESQYVLSKDYASDEELSSFFQHQIEVSHPKKGYESCESFTFARSRATISIMVTNRSDVDTADGSFFVSDDHGIAFLKVKMKKRKICCYYLNLRTLQVKCVFLNIIITDKENCSIYLRGTTLWILQNGEIGVINVAVALLGEDPVRLLSRGFGTMDYWNPSGTGRLMVTQNEIQLDFFHVTLNVACTKLIRKNVTTLKNSFYVSTRRRYVTVNYDLQMKLVIIDFFAHVNGKGQLLRSLHYKATFDRKYFDAVSTEETQKVALRINEREILVLDYVSCVVLQKIELVKNTETENVSFDFSASGKTLILLTQSIVTPHMNDYTKHLIQYDETLKDACLRKLREVLTLNELKMLDIPKCLRNELTFRPYA